MGSRSRTPSGRFVLRIPPRVHAALRAAARAAGMSLNDYCARRLAAPVGDIAVLGAAAAVIERAAATFGAGLVGVVAYGSWTRGEAVGGSDVDVLVVVDPTVRITRALYRQWDEVPLVWDGRAVDPHFVHLPGAAAPPSGVWAEVAVDGLVLFDRDLRVARHLARIRRDVLAGRIVRRVVHGQPYWSEAS
jgi:hypothetical protein